MTVTFLGTGTSQGVPVIACDCEVCTSNDVHDRRLRASIMLEGMGKVIVIDSGPDFRYQMLRQHVQHLDAIVFTHEHKDHIAGMDDIRAFNFRQKQAIDVYATQRVQDALKREFAYVFDIFKYPGIPELTLHIINDEPFFVGGIRFIPIEVLHHKLPVSGFRINDFTYITDAKTVSPQEREKIRGSKILVVNALQQQEHLSHFTLNEALAFAEEIGAEKTYFTHISHKLGKHQYVAKKLPSTIELAYDGLKLEI